MSSAAPVTVLPDPLPVSAGGGAGIPKPAVLSDDAKLALLAAITAAGGVYKWDSMNEEPGACLDEGGDAIWVTYDLKSNLASLSVLSVAEASKDAQCAIRLIEGKTYLIRAGLVYEYNAVEQKIDDFVGRLNAGYESIGIDGERLLTAEEVRYAFSTWPLGNDDVVFDILMNQ
jgi:hypothetical protein